MLVGRHLLIRGRVQGVGFRFFTEQAAHREGLTGWVRNTVDGDVEAHLEGDEAAVTRVELAIRRGPPGSRVESVEVTDVGPSGRGGGFFVRG
jgi:acylphosphatase